MAKGLEKVSFHSNPKERESQRMIKLSHYSTISQTSKIMLKILQARLQQYMNQELPDVQTGFRKGRGTRDQYLWDPAEVVLRVKLTALYVCITKEEKS